VRKNTGVGIRYQQAAARTLAGVRVRGNPHIDKAKGCSLGFPCVRWMARVVPSLVWSSTGLVMLARGGSRRHQP
jgi:hypothetical protein